MSISEFTSEALNPEALELDSSMGTTSESDAVAVLEVSAEFETASAENSLTEETIEEETIAEEDEIMSDEESEDVEMVESAVEVVNGFRKLGLSEPLMRAIEESGYTTPTPIQEQTIALLLQGRDMVGQAQTGSGKTGAFALPLLQRISLDIKQPQVLVLVPTRELAIQVAAAFEKYAAKMNQLRVVAIYGAPDRAGAGSRKSP